LLAAIARIACLALTDVNLLACDSFGRDLAAS